MAKLMSELRSVTLVIPCFNEADGISEAARELLDLIKRLVAEALISKDSLIIFVDDGSTDATWDLIRGLSSSENHIRGIKLSRNWGHQGALLAGLLSAPGDVLITLDADLQDDPGVIPSMLEAHSQGAEIVFGVRASRSADGLFKRQTARLFYSFGRFLGANLIENHAEFRLMSRRAIEELRSFPENNLFLRGMVTELGFSTAIVPYHRERQRTDRTKYTLRKMLSLALDGLTSFSIIPIRLVFFVGAIISVGCFGFAAWALFVRFFTNESVPGWASTVLPMYFLGGVQLLSLGVVGEYVAKIYLETKRRPRFIVEKRTW